MLDLNLTGVWKSTKASIPYMIAQDSGGSIILISSIGGLVALPNIGHYNSAKHGVTGLMRTLAVELAPRNIRCNSVHPGVVNTVMVHYPEGCAALGLPDATRAEAERHLRNGNALPRVLDPVDISNAVLWLASDESRYVTGTTQVVDAGMALPFKIPHN